MAEQAFSLLQDALKESETRVAELDAELKKKTTPNNKVLEQNKVLEHRLEAAESEQQNWKRKAEQLEEKFENERERTRQLKKKLEIAESGPNKAGKKEVNFWRSRAEKFDEETKAFNDRIDELKDALDKADEALKEERECTANASELANERREQISELSEKLDEAQERYEEAQWNLNRASRFARMVVRRRSIVATLIKTVRAKQKSNVALKAGLDGLRKFKAKAEEQQQKLLMQIDEVKTRLKSTEKKLSEQKSLIEQKDNEIVALNAKSDELQAQTEELEAKTEEYAGDATIIRERDSQISNLSITIKELEKEIKKLKEEASGWQKKYEFLSTDLPSSYAATVAEN